MNDWNAIRTEYITGEATYRELAEKYGVSPARVKRMGGKEDWVTQRRQHAKRVLAKSLEAEAEDTVRRLSRVLRASDALLGRIEEAIDQLDVRLCKEVRREKRLEFDDEHRARASREVVQEEETLREVSTIVDRQGLMQITSALRGLKEVQMLRSEPDRREQEAKIANLRRTAEKEEDKNQPIQVTLGAELEAYSE